MSDMFDSNRIDPLFGELTDKLRAAFALRNHDGELDFHYFEYCSNRYMNAMQVSISGRHRELRKWHIFLKEHGFVHNRFLFDTPRFCSMMECSHENTNVSRTLLIVFWQLEIPKISSMLECLVREIS